jgi:LysM repeat protein
MDRRGLVVLSVALMALPVTAVSCGDDGEAGGTLPPIATTTTTTIAITTTTEWVPQTYIIEPGDRLQDIADKYGVDVDQLALLNGITNPNRIEAGDELEIPPPTTPATTTTTSTTTTLAATTTTTGG